MTATHSDLDRIRVRFATFRERSIEERAADAGRLHAMQAAERVLLDTCHRVELVTVDDGPEDAAAVVGRDAVRRVFEVVAGFDSAVIAEEQLLGQVRDMYEAARVDGSTGPILNELFRRALRFGRRVRSYARPGSDRSLADRGATWLIEHIGDAGNRVLVGGTGEMGRLVGARLAVAGYAITVLSRSVDRGQRLLERLDGPGHRLLVGDLDRDALVSMAGVVLAVRIREPLLTGALLEDGAQPWTLDLSSPAAATAEAAAILGDRLMGLDRLGAIAGPTPVLAPAVERRLRTDLDGEVERFVTWLDARRAGDALAVLHGDADAVRRRHLDRLRQRAELRPDQLAAVEAASVALVAELLHGPSVELRRGGADADTVRRMFGLDS